MKVAIVGSRGYPRLELIGKLLSQLPTTTVVISGGARGVDQTAEQEALKLGLRTIIIPADWSKGRGAGYERNHDIVRTADAVVAFWDGESKGTCHTIGLAQIQKKKLMVFGPDGQRMKGIE